MTTIGCTADLSASLMCARPLRLGDEIAALEDAGVDSLHLDVMDGHFVPNLAFSLDACAAVAERSAVPVDVHLMVTDPDRYVDRLAGTGIRHFFFHAESTLAPRLVDDVRDAGMRPGVALSPGTPVETLDGLPAMPVLVMAVPPGFAGQLWVDGTEERVAAARRHVGAGGVVGVDGNVDGPHARSTLGRGASLLVLGSSSLFRPPYDYAAGIARLREALAAA